MLNLKWLSPSSTISLLTKLLNLYRLEPSNNNNNNNKWQLDGDKKGRVKRIWYLSLMRAAKVQASLRIRTVSPEPPLLAHTSSESWGTFRQKARSLAPLNGWACAVTICHDGMLEDTNSPDAAQMIDRNRQRQNSTVLLPILLPQR